MNLKCYFSHPVRSRGIYGEQRIMDIIKSRRVEVINSYDKDIGVSMKYTPGSYSYWRTIWTENIKQMDKCNIALFWLPEKFEISGCFAELQHIVEYQNRIMRRNIHLNVDEQEPYLIQIITRLRNPIIAWALCYNNQLYDNIEDFEKFRQTKW